MIEAGHGDIHCVPAGLRGSVHLGAGVPPAVTRGLRNVPPSSRGVQAHRRGGASVVGRGEGFLLRALAEDGGGQLPGEAAGVAGGPPSHLRRGELLVHTEAAVLPLGGGLGGRSLRFAGSLLHLLHRLNVHVTELFGFQGHREAQLFNAMCFLGSGSLTTTLD